MMIYEDGHDERMDVVVTGKTLPRAVVATFSLFDRSPVDVCYGCHSPHASHSTNPSKLFTNDKQVIKHDLSVFQTAQECEGTPYTEKMTADFECSKKEDC